MGGSPDRTKPGSLTEQKVVRLEGADAMTRSRIYALNFRKERKKTKKRPFLFIYYPMVWETGDQEGNFPTGPSTSHRRTQPYLAETFALSSGQRGSRMKTQSSLSFRNIIDGEFFFLSC